MSKEQEAGAAELRGEWKFGQEPTLVPVEPAPATADPDEQEITQNRSLREAIDAAKIGEGK